MNAIKHWLINIERRLLIWQARRVIEHMPSSSIGLSCSIFTRTGQPAALIVSRFPGLVQVAQAADTANPRI